MLTHQAPAANRWSLFSHMVSVRPSVRTSSVRKTKTFDNAKTLQATKLHGAWWVTKFTRLFSFPGKDSWIFAVAFYCFCLNFQFRALCTKMSRIFHELETSGFLSSTQKENCAPFEVRLGLFLSFFLEFLIDPLGRPLKIVFIRFPSVRPSPFFKISQNKTNVAWK